MSVVLQFQPNLSGSSRSLVYVRSRSKLNLHRPEVGGLKRRARELL